MDIPDLTLYFKEPSFIVAIADLIVIAGLAWRYALNMTKLEQDVLKIANDNSKFIFEIEKLEKEIEKISRENNKILTEVDKLKTEIAKEKIEKVILLAKYKREYFSLLYESVDINKRFNELYTKTKRPSEKLKALFEEMDRFIFEKILPSVNEMAMVADYFYSDDIERRVDFIEEIVIPCFVMLEKHFAYFNEPDILKKSKQIETVVYKENLLTTTRFLLSSPDSEPKQYALDLSKKFIKAERVG